MTCAKRRYSGSLECVQNNDNLHRRIAEAVAKLPERNSIARVRLFGSRLQGNARPDSDVDLIVDFATAPGLIAFVGMQRALGQLLGLPVDLVTPRSLSKYIRDDILASAVTVYEKE